MNSSYVRHGLRPRHVEYTLTGSACNDIGFQKMKPWPNATWNITGLNTFTCVVACSRVFSNLACSVSFSSLVKTSNLYCFQAFIFFLLAFIYAQDGG